MGISGVRQGKGPGPGTYLNGEGGGALPGEGEEADVHGDLSTGILTFRDVGGSGPELV